MHRTMSILPIIGVLPILFSGCKRADESIPAKPDTETNQVDRHGSTHIDHDETHLDSHGHGHDHDPGHDHDEVPLGSVMIGDMKVELAQAHGKVEAGKESHLVVRLSYDDNGATIVRAWLGTKDRLQSLVGMGEYAPSHGDYDIHAVAPDPLPENIMWWIEIQKPDGTKTVGSIKPILE